ncbi:MAG: response regulator [Deltaproteobacteria bacterium]|nr:response regulator [Deltaproteobacteria bacterium]
MADLIERALDAIVAYTRFPCCGLFQLDASGTTLEMVGRRNVSAEVYASARYLPVDGSLTGHAIKRGCVVTTSDISNDSRLDPPTKRALAREGYVEVASVPLIYRGKALGTINLIYQAGNTLSDDERDTLLGIGQTIAIALAQRAAEDERSKLQERVRKSEQLERLGLLAGGLAHDFNNFLTCILGSLSLGKDLLAQGCEPQEVAELLDGAEKASQRAAALVQQLLTFSKGGAPVLQATTRLAALIRESAEFSVHGSSVRLAFDIASDLTPVAIDAAQISRMVQNLVINAVQASPEGGTVTIEVKNEPLRMASDDPTWVRIVVADQGSGIAPEVLPHVFDPYFSTKSGGNGLGLPTVQSIVVAHGGTVEATSEVGKGATFIVRLPGTVHQPSEQVPDVSQPLHTPAGGRALLMDDDAAIRSLAQEFLERDGYEVVATADGDEAVRACQEAVETHRPFAIALLDLTIVGGMGGREAMPRIRALIPSIAAVVCSGYSEDAAMSQYAQHGFDAVLPKPYTLQEFATAIRLARRARSHSLAPGTSD